MEKFDVTKLTPGQTILVKTESGSIYRLKAETVPEPVNERRTLFRGIRATRESDHDLVGRPQIIENEVAVLVVKGDEQGVLQVGQSMELIWDRSHPESKTDWDIQFGPKFEPVTTSRIMDIELMQVQE